MCWRRIPTERSGRSVRESDWMLLVSAHAVPTHVGDGGDSQHRVGLQIQRHKRCTWTPMPVRRQDQMRVSAWIVGSLLFAPWKRSDLKTVIENAHQCIQLYAIYWWIECASNTFSAVTWCSHGIHIQQHLGIPAIEKSKKSWYHPLVVTVLSTNSINHQDNSTKHDRTPNLSNERSTEFH